MANNIRWKAIEHSQSNKKGAHVILVAYQSNGRILNKVVGIVPLFDLRDTNFDGSVSYNESFWAGFSNWVDPYYVFALMKAAGDCSPILEAARQLRDYELMNNTNAELLKKSFTVCSKALTTILTEKALSPGIELNLANTALANLKYCSDTAQFIVQTILETVIVESICLTHK